MLLFNNFFYLKYLVVHQNVFKWLKRAQHPSLSGGNLFLANYQDTEYDIKRLAVVNTLTWK